MENLALVCYLPERSPNFKWCSIPYTSALKILNNVIARDGFEPSSPAPKAGMIDRYTTGLIFL